MGRKLDLSGLTEDEAEHVLQVVQRDMKLREKEEQRLSELKQELEEEGSRCLLLSRRSCFNQRCCIRCCSPFTFLLNPGRRCRDCGYNVCKACRVYNQRDKAWLCSACQKSRLLKTQSLEWFYTNVKTRFKRFGSAKVLKTFYRKHLAERSALPELTESSAYEDSICNEGSFCGSDSTFYRQTKEHSVAETITVALRVAEEAIDEAISKAEFDSASQEKQNEAHYLREHRGELIEELSKTIVQNIISRRKTLTEMRAEYDQDWPLEDNTDLQHRRHHHHHQSDCNQASGSLNHHPDLWRSHSAFSLLDNDPSGLVKDSSQMAAWKSVERLDNAGAYGGVSSVLKSPDGNWIALQSSQLPRPSLLTKRKSLVFSALERESEVASAYEGMDSDSGTEPEHGTRLGTPPPPKGRRGELFSDPEGSWKPKKPPLARLKGKVPPEIGRPSSSCRTSIVDVNFNVEGAKAERRGAGRSDVGKARRSRKKKRGKKGSSSSMLDCREKDNHSQHSSDAATPDTVTSGATTPEPFYLESDLTAHEAKQLEEEEVTLKTQQPAGRTSDSSTGGGADAEVGGVNEDGQREENGQGHKDRGEGDERPWRMEIDLNEGRTEEEDVDEEMKHRLYRLIEHSRLAYLSTDDDLDREDQSEGEWEGDEEVGKTGGLTSKLCQLEEEVWANQFSSTEDELDKVGVADEEKTGQEEEEEEEEEELASKVCRLADQANATQFSSTEDELDRASGGEEEAMEEKLWKPQAEERVEVAQLRDVASFIGASHLRSTEDKPDGEKQEEMNEGGIEREEAVRRVWVRRESFRDLDENMFYLREEVKTESCDVEHVLQDKTVEEEKKDCKVELLKKAVTKTTKAKRQAMPLEKVVQAKTTEELMSSDETKGHQESRPETKCPDKQEGERQEESTIGGSRETAEDSEEEDAEFDRIIRSMLSMTLADMQMEAFKDEGAESRSIGREAEELETSEPVEIENTVESTNASEETGSGKKCKSRGDDVTAESAVGGRTGGIVGERIGVDIYQNKDTKENERREADRDAAEKINLEMHQTLAAKQLKRLEMDDDKQEESKVNEWKLCKETKENLDVVQQSTSAPRGGLLSPEEIQNRYSAVSLRSITTEVLKVLNATEELLQGGEGGGGPRLHNNVLPPHTDPKKLDQQFCRLEENVYVAAGEVYGLEAELSDLEECARDVCSATSDMELSYLEEQVASAAAKVQQSELRIGDISARIAALKSAGLNVDTQRSRFTKSVPIMPVTVESSKQSRRRLPAPPVKGEHIRVQSYATYYLNLWHYTETSQMYRK
uniref:rab effector MyRIP isoform X3 n=1 Tax=Gasterosteus aculeatus aculeatus TaxID=481459 RepID=UPI001A99DFCB|nr:rab effector MyRIP isoform X3 [Gasterosteus aculeatus aculeatus]